MGKQFSNEGNDEFVNMNALEKFRSNFFLRHN